MLTAASEAFAELDRFEGVVPMPAIVDWLRRTPIALRDVRHAIVFSPHRYVRNLLHAGAAYQVLVLCWRNGQRSPIHNHRGSNCGVRVLQGVATETTFTIAPNGMIVASGSREMRPGHVIASSDADIHQVSNLQADCADLVTLHVYSPPLTRMETFSLEAPGATLDDAPIDESFEFGEGFLTMTPDDANVFQPDHLLSPEDVATMIAGVARPLEVIGDGRLPCIAQTGFGFSRIPHILALATDRTWLEMGGASEFVGALVTGPELAEFARDRIDKPVLIYENPAECFYLLHNRAIHERTHESSRGPGQGQIAGSAVIHRSAIIEDNVDIGEGVEIGAFSVIKANAIIGEGSRIAEHCTIGGEGLFFKEIGGRLQNLAHFGGVRIGRGCVVQPGTVIAAAVNFNSRTTIADEVAIGNRATVGHDAFVGAGTTISANAMIAGRARIGEGCWIGASSSISNAIVVGARARVRIGAVVVRDVPEGGDVSGNFATQHHLTLRRMLS